MANEYNDARVRVEYKNRDMKTWSVREYALRDYTDMLRLDLLRLIGDVEDMGEAATGFPSKEEWPEDVIQIFLHIKHKLLDKAGEIGRLPDNLIGDDEEELPGAFAVLVNELTRKQDEE